MKSLYFSCVLFSIFLISSCKGEVSHELQDNVFLSKEVFSDRQDARTEIETFGSKHPVEAVPLLEKAWASNEASGNSWSSDPVVRIAIATQLMAHSNKDHDEYFEYISHQAKSPDTDISTAAISAMSLAKGKESLDLLFGYVNDRRPDIPFTALETIEFRYTTAKEDASLRDELTYMTNLIGHLCNDHQRPIEANEFCAKHQ